MLGKKIMSFLLVAIIISLVPMNANAHSGDSTKQEIYSIIDNLHLQNIKPVLTDVEVPDSVDTIEFNNIEEFEEYLVQLDKEIADFKENMVAEVTIHHLRDGEWIEISEEEYHDIINSPDNLELTSISPYFANYFSQTVTVYDYSLSVVKGKLHSYIRYGIEKAQPYGKFVVDDDIYPHTEHLGYFSDVNQSTRIVGSNGNRIVVEYSFKFYSKIIVSGNEIITLVDRIQSAYTID